MEHSALHALLLTGLIAALGGALAMCWIILPAARSLPSGDESDSLTRQLGACVGKWIFFGALAAAFASGIDLFVQVAELEGQTVFGGANPALVARFATQTTVGQLVLVRIALLLLTAAAARLAAGSWSGGPQPSTSLTEGVGHNPTPLSTWSPDGHRPPLQRPTAGIVPQTFMRWLPVAVPAFGAVLVTSFVSHAGAQPEHRFFALSVQLAHLVAASAWIGVLLHLFTARGILFNEDSPVRITLLADIVRRFSPFALAFTSLLGITGLIAAVRFVGSPVGLFASAYGLTLLVKLGLIAPAVVAGWINFRHVRPKLLQHTSGQAPPLPLFRRMLELEVTSGILIIAVAGILASVSPPGADGGLQLTPAQARAAIIPDLPTTRIENWTEPEDPRGPTEDDLRYSEFTHNWAGVFVTLLGLGWLMQGTAGRPSVWAARAYPFVLVPFGAAISVLANPELWIMRTISPWTALTNPSLLEHQLAAGLIFLLAWLSWRDQRNPEHLRPLGYPLPLIMIAGSLLLLGHAHSDPAIPGDLANLINVQHSVFGACGLFAGTVRWFVLRGLLPPRPGNLLWPAGIIALGVYMALFYREVL